MRTLLYQQVLTKHNILFSQSSQGLHFSYQGANFLLIVDPESDELYLQLAMPNIYSVKSCADKERTLEVTNNINKVVQGVKAVVHDDSVWLHIEMFVDPALNTYFDNLLFSLLSLLHGTRHLFLANGHIKANI